MSSGGDDSPTAPASSSRSRIRPLDGDSARQAVSSLRGYSYQIALTALAWLELADENEIDEVLFVESVEDFDRVSGSRAVLYQIKAESGNISLRSRQVKDAIQNYWNVSRKNNDYTIQFRLLTTSLPVLERGESFDQPGLLLWNSIRECDVLSDRRAGTERIRAFLSKIKFTNDLNNYISHAPVDEFFNDVIAPLKFDTGHIPLSKIQIEIKRLLVFWGHKFGVPPKDSDKLIDAVLQHVNTVAILPNNRVLDREQLIRLLTDHTMRSYPETTIRNLTMRLAGEHPLPVQYVQSLDRSAFREESWDPRFYLEILIGIVRSPVPRKVPSTNRNNEPVVVATSFSLEDASTQQRYPSRYEIPILIGSVDAGEAVAVIIIFPEGSTNGGVVVGLVNFSALQGPLVFVSAVWNRLYRAQQIAILVVSVLIAIVIVAGYNLLHFTLTYLLSIAVTLTVTIGGLILLQRRLKTPTITEATAHLKVLTTQIRGDFEAWRARAINQ